MSLEVQGGTQDLKPNKQKTTLKKEQTSPKGKFQQSKTKEK